MCYSVYGWRHPVKATEETAESNGSVSPGGWLSRQRADCLYTPGSTPGPTLGNEYEKSLPLLSSHDYYDHCGCSCMVTRAFRAVLGMILQVVVVPCCTCAAATADHLLRRLSSVERRRHPRLSRRCKQETWPEAYKRYVDGSVDWRSFLPSVCDTTS